MASNLREVVRTTHSAAGTVADDLKHIAQTALGASTPDAIQDGMDEIAKLAGKKLWHGMMRVAASGFGKGLLAAAALIVIGGALISGFGTAGAIPGLIGLSFEQGLSAGAATAFQFLFSAGGATMLAMGGLMGSIMSVRSHQNKVTAELAEVQALAYANMRTRQQAHEVQQLRGNGGLAQKPHDAQTSPDTSYVARELERRHAAEQQQLQK